MNIFRLHTGDDGLATLVFDHPGHSVNLFDRPALEQFDALLDELAGRTDIRCLVLLSAKPGSFCHGTDIALLRAVTEPEQGAAGARAGQRLFQAWEDLPFPTLAAIRSTCMGGGTELALACSARLLSDSNDLRIGLPEVRLGLVPAWGGCVRLPRRIGIRDALDVILTGRGLTSTKALQLGLADAVVPDASFLHHARDFGTRLQHGEGPVREEHQLRELLLEKNPLSRRIVFDQARKKTLGKTHRSYAAPLRAIEVVQVGIEKGADAGFDAEVRAAAELLTDSVTQNQIHVYQLTQVSRRRRRAEARQGQPAAATGVSVERLGVVGAGVMGGAIALLAAEKGGIPVRLHDQDPRALARGLRRAGQRLYNKQQRRRLSAEQSRTILGRIQPCLDWSGFRHTQLVVEAIVESLNEKQQVLAQLAQRVPETTVLASNTSSLSIDHLAEGLAVQQLHPERVVGLHFFNPVARMPLVEVIAGSHTNETTLATVSAFVEGLGKTPILVRDSPGFLVNRLLTFYLLEALWLLAEGRTLDELDALMVDWGMPVGPFALLDEIGIDIAIEVAAILADTFGSRLPMPRADWQAALIDAGRLGSKAQLGFYRYENGQRCGIDTEVYSLLGLPGGGRGDRDERGESSDRQQLVDRMVMPMVNEAARCLQEGVVSQAADIDLALILGAGFPAFRGGLCRWVDQLGCGELARQMERLSTACGDRFLPSQALLDIAARGGFYAAYP